MRSGIRFFHNFINELKNVQRIEILPYHTFGEYKWKELGLEYPLTGIEPPTAERVENAKQILIDGGATASYFYGPLRPDA